MPPTFEVEGIGFDIIHGLRGIQVSFTPNFRLLTQLPKIFDIGGREDIRYHIWFKGCISIIHTKFSDFQLHYYRFWMLSGRGREGASDIINDSRGVINI